MVQHLKRGDRMDQRQILRRLTELQYTRNDVELARGTYRARGEVIDIFPAESERDAVRVQLFDDEPFTVIFRDPLTGEVLYTDHIVLNGAGEAVSRLPDFRPNELVEVLVKAPVKWLAKKMLLPANRGLHLISMRLKTGDIDSDNEVTIGDYALLSSAFGSFPGIPTYNPNADLDFDDEITIGDYALLSQNFGLTGDD